MFKQTRVILLIFAFLVIINCIEIEGVIEIDGNDNGQFNPFAQLFQMDNIARQMMNGMIDDDDNFDDDVEEIDGQDNSQAVRVKKQTKNNSNKVHKEVVTTRGNGYQTIQITEVHVGHLKGGHQGAGGMPTLIIGKPRNLKMRGEHASPFQMFQAMDDLMESIFDDMANRLILDHLNHARLHEKSIDELDKSSDGIINIIQAIDKDHSHDDHIKVIEVKDITDKKIEIEVVDDKPTIEVSPSIVKEDHNNEGELAISFSTDNTANKDDNIMTAKEKKKQIKEERRRSLFSKICKYVFYVIILFCFYILGRKLLQLLGLIPEQIEAKNEPNGDSDSSPNIELKSSNIKNE